MPKYYRFRVTSPSHKPKRSKQEKEKDKDRDLIEKVKDPQGSWMDIAFACAPGPSWYLRRTSWRESPPLLHTPRHLAAVFRASLQLTNRAMFLLKI